MITHRSLRSRAEDRINTVKVITNLPSVAGHPCTGIPFPCPCLWEGHVAIHTASTMWMGRERKEGGMQTIQFWYFLVVGQSQHEIKLDSLQWDYNVGTDQSSSWLPHLGVTLCGGESWLGASAILTGQSL